MVNRGGLADKARVKMTYRLVRVGTSSVEASTSKAEIEALLKTARDAGAYSVTFAAPGAVISALSQTAHGATSVTTEGDAADTAQDSADKEVAEGAEEKADVGASAGATTGNLDADADIETAAAEEAARMQAENEAAEAAAKAAAEEQAAAAAIAAAAAAEAERIRQEARNGDVVILYNTYKDPFPIKDGVLTAAAIDEEYCLSDAMPGCQVRLYFLCVCDGLLYSQQNQIRLE